MAALLRIFEAYALLSGIASTLVVMAGCNIADQREGRSAGKFDSSASGMS